MTARLREAVASSPSRRRLLLAVVGLVVATIAVAAAVSRGSILVVIAAPIAAVVAVAAVWIGLRHPWWRWGTSSSHCS